MPIIESLLDQDFYAWTVCQVAFLKGHGNVPVTYKFTNRTKDVKLGEIIDLGRLREEIQHVRSLRPSIEEVEFLRDTGYFTDDFLRFFAYDMRLCEPEVWVGDDGQLRITIEDRWQDAIFWEVLLLAIVNELYAGEMVRQRIDGTRASDLLRHGDEAMRRLKRKVEILETRPQLGLMEFGSRRRFSRQHQQDVLEYLLENIPHQVTGTSNVRLAKLFSIKPTGTQSHQAGMAYSGIYDVSDVSMRNSQGYFFRDWWDTYRGPLSIFLTDTFTSDFFFRTFSKEEAIRSWGLRQDSGDPFAFGTRAIRFYEEMGIDPRRKMIVFSDGLNVEKMVFLWDTFSGRIGVGFGWGTNLSFDTGYSPDDSIRPLSIVIKLVESNGKPVVKLSDNIQKAIGDPAAIQRAMRVFGSNGRTDQDVVY